MTLTKQLKEWAFKNLEVDEKSTDDEIKSAVGMALATGELSTEKFTELCSDKEQEEVNEFENVLKGITDTLKELKDSITKGNSPKEEKAETPSKEEKEETPPTEKFSESKPSRFQKMILSATNFGKDSEDDDEKGFNVRVKEAAEMYSTTKTALVYGDTTRKNAPHPFKGRPVKDYVEGQVRKLDEPSDLDMAVAGSIAKFMVNTRKNNGSRTLGFMGLPQHDKELMCYAMENMNWSGSSDGGDFADIKDRKLSPFEQKALIDDSASGGIEAVPIVFDDMVIQTPLLFGELFPLVNTIPLDRGRRVEGVATGTVTGSWGGYDDAAIDLFDTTSYVSAFDTTIFRWEGAIRIGLDFLSDTPIDFGTHITNQYGERLLEDLDDVIATGNGTTQPEGVMNKTGTTSIAFGGATSIGNYESLRYGVSKAEHRSNLVRTAVFAANETTFARMKAIPVGASDARRLFGSGTFGTDGYDDYQMMNRKFAINESMTNNQLFYAILGRYRMYRRRGLTMRSSTEGDFLIRRNEMLMVATARYGGQLERGAVAAVTNTAEA